MNKNQRFQALLKKYRSNRLSVIEYQEFIDLMAKQGAEERQIMDDQAKADWRPSKELLHRYVMENRNKRKKLRRKRIMLWSSAAAIALIAVSYLFFWPAYTTKNVTYHTDYGETQNIELPDGSRVLLNANSTLTWNGDWKKTEQRLVVLDGEAYFDVTKVANTPFDVQASDIRVHVLGTEFNVRNREANAEVFLHEGKVDLSVDSDSHHKITMKPGDYVRYDKSHQTISVKEDEQLNKKAAWVDGMLEFENKKVALILKEFQELYGKQFKIENPGLAERRMDFSLPYADWELVRKALEIAIGAEFTESKDTIIVK